LFLKLKESEYNMTKTEKVLKALQNGEELTAKQIRARFGAGNPCVCCSVSSVPWIPNLQQPKDKQQG
jgi:hypothetical protein